MAHETEHKSNHPSLKQYLVIAVILFAITIVEFGIIWEPIGVEDDLGPTVTPILIGLSAIKFAIVIMYYMHLKFDDRFFGTVFVAGVVLAFAVGGALMTLFLSFDGEPRSYAAAHAVPYEGHHAAEEKHLTDGAEATETEHAPEPVAAGPISFTVAAEGETLTFDTESLSAASGSEITITFDNPSVNTINNTVKRILCNRYGNSCRPTRSSEKPIQGKAMPEKRYYTLLNAGIKTLVRVEIR